jgi:acetyltransferase-like isoleucine patch superfamily enzyme
LHSLLSNSLYKGIFGYESLARKGCFLLYIIKKILWFIKITLIGVAEGFLNFLPEGSYGDVARGKLLKIQVRKCGKNLKVSRNVKVLNAKQLVLGDNVYIGYSTWMNAEFGIEIGDNTMFGPYVIVASGNHTFTHENMSFYGASKGNNVVIGNGCWLGASSVVTSAAKVGEHCLIGANSVISKHIPNNSKVVGNNKVISNVYEEEL